MTTTPTTVYEFDNHKYELKITYGYANRVLEPEFDIRVNELFEGDNMDQLMVRMFLSNSLALKLWWHYVGKNYPDHTQDVVQPDGTIKQVTTSGYDTALDKLTTESLENFKDRWWSAVASFLPQLTRETLLKYLIEWPKMTKERMSKAFEDQLEDKSDATSSSSLPKQE